VYILKGFIPLFTAAAILFF